MFEAYPDLLMIEEACELLKVSRNTLYPLLQNGEIKGFQQGRIWKIPKDAIIDYIVKKSGLNSKK